MKQFARIVTRMQGEDDGLFIGVRLKNTGGLLKPNTVYGLFEVLGEVVLKEIGPSIVADSETVTDSPVGCHWAMDIGSILAKGGASLFLSRSEFDSIRQNQEQTDEPDDE